MRDGYAWVGVSAQASAVDGGALPPRHARRPVGGLVKEEPARYGVAPPPRRPVRARHVRPGRPGVAGAARSRPRAACTPARRGRGGVAVGLLPDDLRRRRAAPDRRLRRHLHPQPGRVWRIARAAPRSARHGCRAICGSAPISRCRSSCSRRRPTSSCSGYAPAQQPNTDQDPDLGGGGHVARRRLHGRRGDRRPRVHQPRSTTARSTSVVQAAFAAFDRWVDDGTPPPRRPVPPGQYASGRRWRSTPTAT